MDINDILLTALILTAFAGLYVNTYLTGNKHKIRQDWEKYKCNPSIIPFTTYYKPDESALENFNKCVFDKQQSSVFNVVTPMSKMMSQLGSVGEVIQEETSMLQDIMNNLTDGISDSFLNYYAVLNNTILSIYEILANMRDTTERIVALNSLTIEYIQNFKK
tara:strand:- start:3086 stop:3571 length:486 start_codon:yes stop_codon:yes gene_type:complete